VNIRPRTRRLALVVVVVVVCGWVGGGGSISPLMVVVFYILLAIFTHRFFGSVSLGASSLCSNSCVHARLSPDRLLTRAHLSRTDP
jgi:hypothetical protein